MSVLLTPKAALRSFAVAETVPLSAPSRAITAANVATARNLARLPVRVAATRTTRVAVRRIGARARARSTCIGGDRPASRHSALQRRSPVAQHPNPRRLAIHRTQPPKCSLCT